MFLKADLCKKFILYKVIICYGYDFIFLQGAIHAKYDAIDKDTPIPTDRQV